MRSGWKIDVSLNVPPSAVNMLFDFLNVPPSATHSSLTGLNRPPSAIQTLSRPISHTFTHSVPSGNFTAPAGASDVEIMTVGTRM